MMCGLIDLNTFNNDKHEDDQLNNGSVSTVPSQNNSSIEPMPDVKISSPPASSSSSSSSICMELWHACAGPLISLPTKGSVVVYLPQGHHLFEPTHFPNYFPKSFPPPHVFCRVLGVELHAEAASDEVYAQVSLIPEPQIEEKLKEFGMDSINAVVNDDEEDDNEEIDLRANNTSHMFCKTLTASDTSTHGGFSVPRRAAEDCFPPLDYNQQRPSQELVAKDLHGQEWRFRHIYRGQPRRHLLTTGWSAFVNRKKLASGDAVLFLRGGDGELRLGIRRASQVKGISGGSFPAFLSEQMSQTNSNLKGVLDSISTTSVFNVFYNPRLSCELIIPLRRFLKSLDHPLTVGLRLKMRFETEDASERRFTGVITGISEMDPVRWPGSKWKCLLVRWDEKGSNRVSPWEIEPITCSANNTISCGGLKRSRIGLPLSKPDYPIPDWRGQLIAPRKVLQGQEIMGFSATASTASRTSNPAYYHPTGSGSGNMGIPPGFDARSDKVLQGQEIYQGVRKQNRGVWSNLPNSTPPLCSSQVSSPSSVLMFQHAASINSSNSSSSSALYAEGGGNHNYFFPTSHQMINGPLLGQRLSFQNHDHSRSTSVVHYQEEGHYSVEREDQKGPRSKASCRLFGFSLIQGAQQGGGGDLSKEGNCGQVGREIHAVRDLLLDIAL